MRLFNRKSQQQRLLETVSDSLEGVPGGVNSLLAGAGSGRGVKAGLIAAVGFAGLTAASAAISSLRRRGERSE